MSVPAAALPKLPFAVLAGILALQAGLLFDLAGRSSATIDEEVYINAGVDQIVRGSHYSNPEHPPFAKDLIGLAVVGHDPHAGADRSQPIMETTMWSKAPAARKALLRSARMPSMGLALLTSVVAFWGATLLAGLWAGCIAAALFAFSPVALGHGSMATLDATVTCMTTLALVSSYQAWQLRSVQWRRLGATVAGIYLGAALGTKLSALYTLPVLFCACAYGGYRRRELRSTVVFLLIGLAATAVTLWAAHHFSVSTVRGFPVPMNRYFKGLDFQLRHAEMGHLNYLWGEVGTRGWWHYFIVGLAVKIPHPVQILFVLSALSLFLPDPEGGARRRKWALAMAFPTFLFAAMSFASTVQIGVKYLLPAAPLAHIAIAGGAMTWTRFLPGRLLV
ncbi:MAG: phospholipid carrier-dependent glycosyltransferase, partial [Myxococcota bacterium]